MLKDWNPKDREIWNDLSICSWALEYQHDDFGPGVVLLFKSSGGISKEFF